jgi:hypothetical protein
MFSFRKVQLFIASEVSKLQIFILFILQCRSKEKNSGYCNFFMITNTFLKFMPCFLPLFGERQRIFNDNISVNKSEEFIFDFMFINR